MNEINHDSTIKEILMIIDPDLQESDYKDIMKEFESKKVTNLRKLTYYLDTSNIIKFSPEFLETAFYTFIHRRQECLAEKKVKIEVKIEETQSNIVLEDEKESTFEKLKTEFDEFMINNELQNHKKYQKLTIIKKGKESYKIYCGICNEEHNLKNGSLFSNFFEHLKSGGHKYKYKDFIKKVDISAPLEEIPKKKNMTKQTQNL